jgi:hypothetical protein
MARDYSADFQKILEQLSLEEVRGTETPAADLLALNMSDSKGRRFNANHLRGALRAGESAGHGSLIVGRRGYPTRFAWSKVPAAVVKTASAKPAAASKASAKAKAPPTASNADTVSHSLVLRPGVTTLIELPADLTAREAVRLAHWVQALPFE